MSPEFGCTRYTVSRAILDANYYRVNTIYTKRRAH
jgi:hypothetical protein